MTSLIYVARYKDAIGLECAWAVARNEHDARERAASALVDYMRIQTLEDGTPVYRSPFTVELHIRE